MPCSSRRNAQPACGDSANRSPRTREQSYFDDPRDGRTAGGGPGPLGRPGPGVGREQAGRRPAVVVNGNSYHGIATVLSISVPVTAVNRHRDNHVRPRGALGPAVPSYAMTEQDRTISRTRHDGLIGAVDDPAPALIRHWIDDFLA